VISVALVLTAAFLGGFAGAWHPVGDSLAVFRVPIAVVLGLVFIWSPWPWFVRWFVAVICIAAIAQIVAQKYVSHPPGPVVVYQKNLLFENDQVAVLQSDIEAANPDIIALQELTSRNAALVRNLRDAYPYQASCAQTRWSRVAILSRWPVEGEICIEGRGLVGIQVVAPEGTFWAFSLHAYWPWPNGQADQMKDVLPVFASLDGPIVLAGDFNMVPWSHIHRKLAATSRASRAGPLFATFWIMGAPLPIDHVYAPGGGRASPRPLAGSDHVGVLAEVVVFQ
jgi:endonuclease/exonuclease/phosphatase (EEP) superfamily protein YafD